MGRFARVLSVVIVVSALSTSSLRAALVTNLGHFDGNNRSAATDVNDAGVVVGVSFFSDQSTGNFPVANRGFVYTGSGAIQPLTPVGTTSVATAVNNTGVIVG